MVYKNEISKLNDCKNDLLKRMLIYIVPAYIWAMFTLVVVLRNYDNFIFIITITFFGGLISTLFGILISQNRIKKEYFQYMLSIEDNSITIASKSNSNTIDINEITNITKNEKDVIIISTQKRKISISPYLEKYENLKDELSSITSIDKTPKYIDYLGILAIVFFCGLFLVRFIPDYRLYLFVAFGFVITTVINSIKLYIGSIKKSSMLINLLINGVLLYYVLRNIIYILNEIVTK